MSAHSRSRSRRCWSGTASCRRLRDQPRARSRRCEDDMANFLDAIRIERFANAKFFAGELFRECFAIDFPVPRNDCGLSIPTPPSSWHQFVAFYKWSATHIEPVGFCNWIRYDEVYLEGGMCVRRNFYRRLPREHWRECRALGGVAQRVMETAARRLNDAPAWFGYCGDKKAAIVDARVGYVPTRHRYLIVNWFQTLPVDEQERLIDKIAGIGPF